MNLPFAYRFRPDNDNTLSELEESYIYFQNPKKLNDPFDCYPDLLSITDNENELKYFFQFLEPMISISEKKKIKTEILQNNYNFLKIIIIERLNEFINKFGIACLSISPANLMMWSHYANFHKGICLHYDTSKDKEAFNKIRPIEYKNKFEQKEFSPLSAHNEFEHLLYFKSEVWKNEYELRVVKNRQGKFPVNRNSLKSIIFGLKTTPEYKTRIFDLTNQKYPDLTYFQSEPLKNSFGLRFNKVT